MSKNITIAEGTQAKNFNTVHKLRTNLIGGGTQYWVPEDEAGAYANLSQKSITANGTYRASDDSKDGFSQVTVNVSPNLTTKTITENGRYYANDDNAQGYSSVEVNVSSGINLIEKTITENGTYYARNEGADGYSKVIVGGIGEVSGISPIDGNEIFIEKNPTTGEIVQTEIPSKIVIDTKPTKLLYSIGETVDITGMVVKAYKNDDSLWTGTGYSSGIVPNSELILDPTRVTISGGTDITEYSDGDGVNAQLLKVYGVMDQYDGALVFRTDPIGLKNQDTYDEVFLGASTVATMLATQYNDDIYVMFVGDVPPGVGSVGNFRFLYQIPYQDSFYYYGNYSLGLISNDRFVNVANPYADKALYLPESTKDPTLSGTLRPSKIGIKVSWNRPKDNVTLITRFNVSIREA